MSAPAASAPRNSPSASRGGLRHVHLGMIDAVLGGEGVARVAALAAAELGGSVAIVLPGMALVVVEPQLSDHRLSALRRYVNDRVVSRPAQVPAGLIAEVPVRSGDERLGTVVLMDAQPRANTHEILELAALATVTAVALQDASVTRRRGCASLLDDLRASQAPSPADILARARRLGADLGSGASALVVRCSGSADRTLAVIAEAFPGALAAPRGNLVEAVLPVPPDGTPAAAGAAARRLAHRLNRASPTGLSPFEPDIATLPRALTVAELALGAQRARHRRARGPALRQLAAAAPHRGRRSQRAARARRRHRRPRARTRSRLARRPDRHPARVPGSRRKPQHNRTCRLRPSAHRCAPAHAGSRADRPRCPDARRPGPTDTRPPGAGRTPRRGGAEPPPRARRVGPRLARRTPFAYEPALMAEGYIELLTRRPPSSTSPMPPSHPAQPPPDQGRRLPRRLTHPGGARLRGMRGALHAPTHPGEDRLPWRRALCGRPNRHMDCAGVSAFRMRQPQSGPVSAPAEPGRAQYRALRLAGCVMAVARNRARSPRVAR